MKLCIFGASGQTGKAVLKQAVAGNHEVVAAVRSPNSISELSDKIITVQCDVSQPIDSQIFSNNPDIAHVVIALGTKELWNNTVRSVGTRHILEALKIAGLNPHIWVISAAGVGDSWENLGLVSKLFAKLLLPSVMKEHTLQENIVSSFDLDFTILRASGLTNNETNTNYQIVTSGKLPNAQVSRHALACCIVKNLNKHEWINKNLVITSAN